jgi:hypothetical protein
MLLRNGGARVALLAFVQAIWISGPDFLEVVVYGMACFLAGLVFSVVGQFARMRCLFTRNAKGMRKRNGLNSPTPQAIRAVRGATEYSPLSTRIAPTTKGCPRARPLAEGSAA